MLIRTGPGDLPSRRCGCYKAWNSNMRACLTHHAPHPLRTTSGASKRTAEWLRPCSGFVSKGNLSFTAVDPAKHRRWRVAHTLVYGKRHVSWNPPQQRFGRTRLRWFYRPIGAKNPSQAIFHKVKQAPHKVMLLSNTHNAFFFGIMLLSVSRFTRISGMWYLVAFGEIYLLTG